MPINELGLTKLLFPQLYEMQGMVEKMVIRKVIIHHFFCGKITGKRKMFLLIENRVKIDEKCFVKQIFDLQSTFCFY